MIDAQKLEMVGANLDAKSLLGTVGWKGAVNCTVVNGKVVVKDGRLTGIDEERTAFEGHRLVHDYLNR